LCLGTAHVETGPSPLRVGATGCADSGRSMISIELTGSTNAVTGQGRCNRPSWKNRRYPTRAVALAETYFGPLYAVNPIISSAADRQRMEWSYPLFYEPDARTGASCSRVRARGDTPVKAHHLRRGPLMMRMHRRRPGRLPSRSHGARFLDHDGHLTRPGMVERKRQRKGLSLAERLSKTQQHNVRPSRAQCDGLPGRDIYCSKRTHPHDPSLH